MRRHETHFKDPSLWKENKASSGAEDDAKSAEVGTHEVGYWSDLGGEQTMCKWEKFRKKV